VHFFTVRGSISPDAPSLDRQVPTGLVQPTGCVEQLQEGVRALGLPLNLIQLQAGRLAGDLLPLQVGPLQLLRLRVDRGLHGRGTKPLGRQVVALDLEPWRHQQPLVAHGERLPADCLFGLAPRNGIHLSTGGPCSLAILTIDRERFQHWASDLGCPELGGAALDRNWLAVDPDRQAGLRAYLRQLFAVAELQPARLARNGWPRLVADDLVPLVVEALAPLAGQSNRLPRPIARIELVKAAQGWMDEHPTEPITLDALCRRVHAGRRSLIQGFREHLGMGPMAYLKRQRLHGARRVLLAADRGHTCVASVAGEFGFLNAGHFAIAYRELFGERPSITLQGGTRPV
jgi:AraC family transcriptional regulator, ethanolamine operon transcriptional activator